jgi:hypothetical protein
MRYSIAKTLALLMLSAVSLAGSVPASLAADDQRDDNIVLFAAEDGASLSSSEMATDRGAFGVTTLESDQTLAASTSGNSLNVGGNMTNGTIAFGDNMGGFGSYVMNTGNNSTINSAVAVNVQLAPVAP